MPTIQASSLRVNTPIEAAAPDATLVITMDRPMPIGAYTFQLEVLDDSNNRSAPVQVRITIVDNQAPSAVISAPRTVAFNTEFTLSGAESRDIGGGTIARYIWTLLQ